MISVGGQPAVLYRGDHRPATLTEGSRVVFAPTATTVTGEGGVTINHTYNDKIDVLKIYGKCVQDGTPSPDNPVPIKSVHGTLTISNLDGSQSVTIDVPELYNSGYTSYSIRGVDVMEIDSTTSRMCVKRSVKVINGFTNTLNDNWPLTPSTEGVLGAFQAYSVGWGLEYPIARGGLCEQLPMVKYASLLPGLATGWAPQGYYPHIKIDGVTTVDELLAWLQLHPLNYIMGNGVIYRTDELIYTTIPTYPGGTVVTYTPDEGAVENPVIEVETRTTRAVTADG